MRPETIQKLCCPFDKKDLQLTTITTGLGGEVIEGFFTCSTCNRVYPVIKGIPVMSPDEYREFRLEQPVLNRWEKQLGGRSFQNFRLVADANGENKNT